MNSIGGTGRRERKHNLAFFEKLSKKYLIVDRNNTLSAQSNSHFFTAAGQ